MILLRKNAPRGVHAAAADLSSGGGIPLITPSGKCFYYNISKLNYYSDHIQQPTHGPAQKAELRAGSFICLLPPGCDIILLKRALSGQPF